MASSCAAWKSPHSNAFTPWSSVAIKVSGNHQLSLWKEFDFELDKQSASFLLLEPLYFIGFWEVHKYTVGKITPVPAREVRSSDFGQQARKRMYFPWKGSQFTHSHHSIDFYWKDYCPVVFRFGCMKRLMVMVSYKGSSG